MTDKEQAYEWRVYQITQMGVERKVAERLAQEERGALTKYKNGLWQYLVDHYRIEPNGNLRVMFYVRDKADFFRRVQARVDGQFMRYEVEKVEKDLSTVGEVYRQLQNLQRKQKEALNSEKFFIRVIAVLYRKYVLKKKRKRNYSVWRRNKEPVQPKVASSE